MKIYLAAKYSRMEELREYRNQLIALGHTVTSRWLDGNHEQAGNMGYRSFAGTDRECLRLPHQIYVKDFEDETGELYIAEVHNITKFRNGVQ